MSYLPKVTKYKKYFKKPLQYKSIHSYNSILKFGLYGLQLKENALISPKHLESMRKILTKYTNRRLKIWYTIKPNRPYYQKPIEMRMGKGKGNKIKAWYALLHKGQIMFELSSINFYMLYLGLCRAKKKLPYKTIIRKNRAYSSNG